MNRQVISEIHCARIVALNEEGIVKGSLLRELVSGIVMSHICNQYP